MADGGTVSIDYSPCPALAPAAPMVIFLHTITGSARETSHFMKYATRRGWRSCVFNRRGHTGIPLTYPSFNVMGEASDKAAQVAAVVARHPGASYLAMVGTSATRTTSARTSRTITSQALGVPEMHELICILGAPTQDHLDKFATEGQRTLLLSA